MIEDSSIEQYQKAVREFLPQVGVKAELYTSIEHASWKKGAYSVSLYPHGITNSHRGYLRTEANSIGELWADIQAKWAEHKEAHRQQVTRQMALAIIRITTELGECTDAALRNEFDPAQIASYGKDACTEADAMGGRGPFSITMKGGANGAPDLEVA
ncbi:hypothetical protein [Bradyrhizobium sp. USDA 4452]